MFIGDVRSLPLWGVFHTWVEQHGGAHRGREVELVIDQSSLNPYAPAFPALGGRKRCPRAAAFKMS
jgi:hypothetical protein